MCEFIILLITIWTGMNLLAFTPFDLDMDCYCLGIPTSIAHAVWFWFALGRQVNIGIWTSFHACLATFKCL